MAEKKDLEKIFNKKEEELSEMEKMMAEIIDKNAAEAPAAPPAEPKVEAPKPPVKKKRELHPLPVIETPPKAEAPAEEAAKPKSTARDTLQRNEKKASKALKKNSKLPVIAILLGMIALAALLFNAMINRIREPAGPDNREVYEAAEAKRQEQSAEPADFTIPTPEPEDVLENLDNVTQKPGSIVIMSGTGGDEVVTPVEGVHYQIFPADVSWMEAKANCDALGGHLVTISDDDEMRQVIELAEELGLQRVWIGCHRSETGDYIWENGEKIEIPDEWWGKGEPSYVDKGDNVAEDYLLLWKSNGKWVLNDSRNDPVKDYPQMYSGNIAYICEFEQN